jgi:hypothetical protein
VILGCLMAHREMFSFWRVAIRSSSNLIPNLAFDPPPQPGSGYSLVHPRNFGVPLV